jgi:hypothetical protein
MLDVDLRKATRHILAVMFGFAICTGAAYEARRTGLVPQWFVLFATGIVGSLVMERSMSKGVLDADGNPIVMNGIAELARSLRQPQPPPPPDSSNNRGVRPAEPMATTLPAEKTTVLDATVIDTTEKAGTPTSNAPPRLPPPRAAVPTGGPGPAVAS